MWTGSNDVGPRLHVILTVAYGRRVTLRRSIVTLSYGSVEIALDPIVTTLFRAEICAMQVTQTRFYCVKRTEGTLHADVRLVVLKKTP